VVEHRFFPEGTVPHVSTPEFHVHRERAPHLEQPVHQGRLHLARDMVAEAVAAFYATRTGPLTTYPYITDLGCGDGGLLQLLKEMPLITAHGYDFQPSNEVGWRMRGVQAEQADVFGADRDLVDLGDISITTEVLEHLADPHSAVRWIGTRSRYLVTSSPWGETPESHDECHAWGWDQDGYRALIEQGGFTVVRHETVGQFQVILGERR
jgi:hypothetical protein